MDGSLAGLLLGKTKNQIVVSAEKTIAIRGKWLYCRKCRTPLRGDGTLVLPDMVQADHSLLLVLAIGEKCTTDIRVGSIISTPMNDALWIMQSPYHPEEYFIGEPIAQLTCEPEDNPCQ